MTEARKKDLIKIFEEANKLISFKTWTRKTTARDATGKPVAFNDPTACKFCIMGAIDKAFHTLVYEKKLSTYRRIDTPKSYTPTESIIFMEAVALEEYGEQELSELNDLKFNKFTQVKDFYNKCIECLNNCDIPIYYIKQTEGPLDYINEPS